MKFTQFSQISCRFCQKWVTIAAIGSQRWLNLDFTDFFDKACSVVLPHIGGSLKRFSMKKDSI